MRMRRGVAVAGILGGLLWSATAHAQPPINLLAPTALSPASGSAIHVTPLPPPTVLSAPQARGRRGRRGRPSQPCRCCRRSAVPATRRPPLSRDSSRLDLGRPLCGRWRGPGAGGDAAVE